MLVCQCAPRLEIASPWCLEGFFKPSPHVQKAAFTFGIADQRFAEVSAMDAVIAARAIFRLALNASEANQMEPPLS